MAAHAAGARAARLVVAVLAAAGGAVGGRSAARRRRRGPPRNRWLELSASFEALAARVSPSTVQVIASGLVVDPDATTSDGLVERRRSSGSG